MRNVYIFLILLICVTTVNAQVIDYFSTQYNYVNGALTNSTNWVADKSSVTCFWSVDTADGKASTVTNNDGALWTKQLPSITGSSVTFEVNFKFIGDFGYTVNTNIAQIGFYNEYVIDAGGASRDYIYLSFNSNNGALRIKNRNGVDFADLTTKSVSNWIGDELTAKVALTKGNTSDDFYISVILINKTTNESTEIGKYGANHNNLPLNNAIINYANNGNGKARGFFKTITLQDGDPTTEESMEVSSVSLTNGYTLLSTKEISLPEFMLSNNPVGETVEISGVEAGSEINIYTITGAKASNHVYNGSSLNLSHLNTGVYFMETPGFAVKKMLKK